MTTEFEPITTDDYLDVRDIIARYEYLQDAIESAQNALKDVQEPCYDDSGNERIETATCDICRASWNDAAISAITPAPAGRCPFESDHEEIADLRTLLDDLRGNGGDEQWNGDWYPVTLVRESEFEDYVQEMLEDCGDVSRDLPIYVAIDWAKTAENVSVDYSEVVFDGVTYLYR